MAGNGRERGRESDRYQRAGGLQRRASQVTTNASTRFSLASGTTITNLTVLNDLNDRESTLTALRAKAERNGFGALFALTAGSGGAGGSQASNYKEHSKFQNVVSAAVLLGEFFQFIPIITSGRFASVWGIAFRNSNLLLGYFESSFGVLAGLYVAVLVLMLCAALSSVWIASDQGHTGGAFSHFLKTYVLRWILLGFVTVGYLPAAVILLRIPAMCLPWRPDAPRDAAGFLLVSEYADQHLLCAAPQTLLMCFVGVLAATALIGFSALIKSVYHVTMPTSPSIQARSHSRAGVVEIVVRSLVTILFVISNTAVGDVMLMTILAGGSFTLLYIYFVHLPYFSTPVNMFKVFGATYLSVYATALPVAYFVDFSVLAFIGVLSVAILAGVLMAFLARRRIRKLALKHRPLLVAPMESEESEGGGARHLNRSSKTFAPGTPFRRITEVEIAARYLLAQGNAGDAGQVFERGLGQFPNSPLLRLQYAWFLAATGAQAEASVMLDRLETQGEDTGSSHLIDVRFGIFALRKDLLLRRQQEGGMDVASYVKYNARLAEATRAHASATQHISTLWSLVLRSDEEFFRRSPRLAKTIHRQTEKANRLFVDLIREYPTVSPIIRAYADFVDEIHHDELKSERLYLTADYLEGRGGMGAMVGAGRGGGMIGSPRSPALAASPRQQSAASQTAHLVPSERTDCVLTITAGGRILSASSNISIFGRTEQDVIGHSVSELVRIGGTSAFQAMEAYSDGSGRSDLEVVDGWHRNGTLVRVVADLTPVSVGADPRFALVLRPVRRTASITYGEDGVILSASASVYKLIGWRPKDLVGKNAPALFHGLPPALSGSQPLLTVPALQAHRRRSSVHDQYDATGPASSTAVTCTNRFGKTVDLEALSVVMQSRRGAVHSVYLSAPAFVCRMRVGVGTGIIEDASDSARVVVGLPMHALVGAPLSRIFRGMDRVALRTLVDQYNPQVYLVHGGGGFRHIVSVSIHSTGGRGGSGSVAGGTEIRSASGSSISGHSIDDDDFLTVVARLVSEDSYAGGGGMSFSSQPSFSDGRRLHESHEAFLHSGGMLGDSGSGADIAGDNDSVGSFNSSEWSASSAGSRSGGRAGTVGGSIKKKHRFRAKAVPAVVASIRCLAFVAILSIVGFFVYALLVRADVRQSPLRLGLHAAREMALVDAMFRMREATLGWTLADVATLHNETHASSEDGDIDHDDDHLDPSIFDYHHYAEDVEIVVSVSPVLVNGNASVASMYEKDATMAETWLNTSRAQLVVPTGDCSDSLHTVNVTYEAAVGLMSTYLLEGMELSPINFVTCHDRHALPAAEYFLMRNSLSDLRTVLVAGLDLETEAGRAELIAIHSAVYIVCAGVGGLVVLMLPCLLLALYRLRRERERAVLVFGRIPKTEVARVARETRKQSKAAKAEASRARQVAKDAQRSSNRVADESVVGPFDLGGGISSGDLAGGRSQQTVSSAVPSDQGQRQEQRRRRRRRNSSMDASDARLQDPAHRRVTSFRDVAPDSTVDSFDGRCQGSSSSSSRLSSTSPHKPTRRGQFDVSLELPAVQRAKPAARGRTSGDDSANADKSDSPIALPPILTSISSLSNSSFVAEHSESGQGRGDQRRERGKKRREETKRRIPGTPRGAASGKTQKRKKRQTKGSRGNSGAASGGGILKATARTDYAPPQKATRAWGANADSLQVDAYTQSLLRGLAPRWSSAFLIVFVALLFVASGLLHFSDLATREAKLVDYAVAVRREVEADFILWFVREMYFESLEGAAGDAHIFADSNLDPYDLVAQRMDDFRALHARLMADPASEAEQVHRHACVFDHAPVDSVVTEIEVANTTQCVYFDTAVQWYLRVVSQTLDAMRRDAPPEEIEPLMVWLNDLAAPLILPSIVDSAHNYYEDVSEFSDGLQSVIFAIQFLLVAFGLVLFHRVTESYRRGTQQVFGLLQIIPHRVVDAAPDLEEVLRTLE